MKYSQAMPGRVFVIRLEDGDIVHEEIEKFAVEHGIMSAALIILGGADSGSKLVVGPKQARGVSPINPMEHILNDVHEVSGTGTLFPDEDGRPLLHMHMACGRGSDTATGCIRSGVKVWHIMEVILIELTKSSAIRTLEAKTGLKLLQP